MVAAVTSPEEPRQRVTEKVFRIVMTTGIVLMIASVAMTIGLVLAWWLWN